MDVATNELLTNDIFRWSPSDDTFQFLGRSFVLEHIGERVGRKLDSLTEEMQRKERYLRLMDQLGVTYFKDVSRAIASYYVDAAGALAGLEKRAAR